MLDQKMISQEEYEAAVAEELNYRPYEEYQQEIKSTYSYFTDEVIKDVISDLMEQKGYSELVAENMVYSGGLKIYATIDTKVQNALDERLYRQIQCSRTRKSTAKCRRAPWSSRTSRAISSRIAGGRGEKNAAQPFVLLTRPTHAVSRVPRSSRWQPMVRRWMQASLRSEHHGLRPRAPRARTAMPWPMNDGKHPTGRALTIKEGMTRSLNTISVQVLNTADTAGVLRIPDAASLASSWSAAAPMRTAPCSRISTLAPLALGALTDGVTVREMAGGFSTFINDGVLRRYAHLYAR
ncbi:MAG: hypothetical protein ACLR4Z_15175 [Butyricicoccaceae bacterium]